MAYERPQYSVVRDPAQPRLWAFTLGDKDAPVVKGGFIRASDAGRAAMRQLKKDKK